MKKSEPYIKSITFIHNGKEVPQEWAKKFLNNRTYVRLPDGRLQEVKKDSEIA